VIENMSYFQPTDMPDRRYFLFGEGGGRRLVELTSSALLGKIPIIEKIRERADLGKVFAVSSDELYAEIYRSIAEKLNKRVAFRNTLMAPTKKVEQA
ncbi:MAG TPA: P-loop NTPase, partial [Saprospiraceae bacterium]|nr:P-loop NTPase [Saprospiraceae bacterium]